MEKKKLLIYAHYYIPDTASTGQILRELVEGMLDKFDITIICVVPSYLGTIEDKYKTQKYYEEEINGVKVLRIRVPEFSKTNKKSRVRTLFPISLEQWLRPSRLARWTMCSLFPSRRSLVACWRLGQVGETRQIHL